MGESSDRAAVFFINGLGDHLLMLPVVRALGAIFRGRLAFAGLPIARELFRDVGFERFLPLRVHDLNGAPDATVDDAVAQIGEVDVVISLNRSAAGARALADRAKARVTAGFFPEFDVHAPFTRQTHCIDLGFALAGRFSAGLDVQDYAQPPSLAPGAVKAAAALRSLLPPGIRVLAVHADTAAPKMWSAVRLSKALDLWLARHPSFIALLLGDRDVGVKSSERNGRIFSCLGAPFDVSLALVSSADLFLGVDSCLLHAADLFRIPTAALFGGGDVVQFGCRFCRHEHLVAESMNALTVDAVVAALDRLACDQARPSSWSVERPADR
jgi:ADP-heptose:LPS heptosyltransferase